MFCYQIIGHLFTTTIAAFIAYVAYQQWKTNNQKLKFDLFEQRFKIYHATIKILGDVVTGSSNDYQHNLRAYYASAAEGYFLFDSKTAEYLDEICKRGNNIMNYVDKIKQEADKKPNNDQNILTELIKKKQAEMDWFNHNGLNSSKLASALVFSYV